MWIFTSGGFVSAVRDSRDRTIIVRSRDRKSLESISDAFKAEIKKTPMADYPYRVVLGHDHFAEWVMKQASLIDYSNFKSVVALTRGKVFASALGEVWSTMHQVEDKKARERINNDSE